MTGKENVSQRAYDMLYFIEFTYFKELKFEY